MMAEKILSKNMKMDEPIMRMIESQDNEGNTWEILLIRHKARYKFEIRLNKVVVGKNVYFTSLQLADMYWNAVIKDFKVS